MRNNFGCALYFVLLVAALLIGFWPLTGHIFLPTIAAHYFSGFVLSIAALVTNIIECRRCRDE